MTEQSKREGKLIQQQQYGGQPQVKKQTLQALSRRNLWQVILFMSLSIGALSVSELDLLGALPENVRIVLGYPPPAFLVTIALGVYCFSALTNILTHMGNESVPVQTWSQLAYRTVFYLFYAVSGSLASHFMAVFSIGCFLYALEQLHIWNYCQRTMPQDNGLIGEQ